MGIAIRLGFVRPLNSINGPVVDDEIADFVVLSGPNGCGKSNFLEAIHQGAIAVEGVPQTQPGAIRFFGLAQLVATAEGAQSAMSFRDRWIQLSQHVASLVSQLTGQGYNIPRGSDQLEEAVRGRLVHDQQVTEPVLHRMVSQAGKRLIDFTDDDFRVYSPLLVGIRDPFTLTVGELFLTYHARKVRNEFLQWLAEKKQDPSVRPMTDEEFVGRYGPPPWELLDETLASIGLDYRFDPPVGTEEDLVYEARLVHGETGAVVTTAQLSSGEKTLMAVAMSLYTGSRLGEAIELPRVLLLDEPDASLHPSMVQSLLRVTGDVFCRQYGVKVLLATHSPSTVALAPAESIYTMRRSEFPRLRRVARDETLASLTVGLPTLSVRIENRRQVFVESEHDQACYQELFRLLHQSLATPISLEFIASGMGGQGNANAVIHLVTKLRGAGNTSVVGVVDRDERLGAPAGIYFIASRYSIENLVLDPLLVGTFLLREHIVSAEAMLLPPGLRHFKLEDQHAQAVSNFITESVRQEHDDITPVMISYVGGLSLAVPKFYLDLRGHDLEERLCKAFPRLRAHRAEALKRRVIETVVGDMPGFMPKEVVALFTSLLASDG